ncbi:MAG: hypothetical protein HGB01_00255 [Chlorobiaceae bacterium]|nr:hypothetical protein [Chlorobiaceae bacterium]
MTVHISPESLQRILGIPPTTPLDPPSMGRALRVTACPAPGLNPRLAGFASALLECLRSCGASVTEEHDARNSDSRFAAGTVVIAPGSFPDHLLPINRVSTLYNNIIVGIYDEPPPVSASDTPQETLDAVVGRLAWDMVHLVIYLTGDSWTICSMNGGVTTFQTAMPLQQDVLRVLVPKLTAQVVPPRAGDIEIRHGELDTSLPWFRTIARDFEESGRIWDGNPLLMNHTSTEGLAYRNAFYRKIVARYLDERTGMSYGFLARQLPVSISPAVDACSNRRAPDTSSVEIGIAGKRFFVPIPEVRVVTTRSGCRKTAVDRHRDLIETSLADGRIRIATAAALSAESAVRPSFDTLTIVAHALGNALVSSILQTLRPEDRFASLLADSGAAMTHWHHYPDDDTLPEGYIIHGKVNPPVSCSTPQSAVYSLIGKLDALEMALGEGVEYLGDAHFEPGHGTNLVGVRSLAEIAKMMNGSKVNGAEAPEQRIAHG